MNANERESKAKLIWRQLRANRVRIFVGIGLVAILALASVVAASAGGGMIP
jgi:hypothetical protein